MITLYGYYRSSASYRVRIALNAKCIPFKQMPIHLIRDGGEQFTAGYLQINPQALVPTLIDNGVVITQSLAILEYLEESYPDNLKLLPRDKQLRSRARQIAQLVATDIHPLNNLRVLSYLKETLGVDEEAKLSWYRHWITLGFTAVERLLSQWGAKNYVVGEELSIADCCLIPQVYNALRFNCDLTPYPIIQQINQHVLSVAAVQAATPEQQEDA